MADDKRGRDKQARDAERRRREREIATELARGDEPEPPVETAGLGDLEADLEALSFPVTGAELVATVGDRAVESAGGTDTVAELVPAVATETFDSPAAVRVLIRRPTVAAAMKRVVEASAPLRDAEFGWTRRKAYETTFRELASVDADDEDEDEGEGITVVADWIVDQIHERDTLPSSRAVRRRAAKFCRANGHQVRADEWLGV